MILCCSFQAWLDLMCRVFLSLSYSEIHVGLLTGFWQSADFTLVIPPSSFSLPLTDREILFLFLSFPTPTALAQPGKFRNDFKENRKGLGWFSSLVLAPAVAK